MGKWLPARWTGNTEFDKKGKEFLALVALQQKNGRLELEIERLKAERETMQNMIVALAEGRIDDIEIDLKEYLDNG